MAEPRSSFLQRYNLLRFRIEPKIATNLYKNTGFSCLIMKVHFVRDTHNNSNPDRARINDEVTSGGA